MFGYAGKILRVNLSERHIKEEKLSEDILHMYLGGRGLGTFFLYRELKPRVDPLGPANKLIFLTGPVAGTSIPGSSRWVAMAKSPLTGCIGEAYSGGFFAARLKFSGFDGVIVEGASESPVYIYIHDGEAEIREANHLWGKNTDEVEVLIKKEVQRNDISVASIGIAGENLVKFACIVNDKSDAAGRTGMGAVMGSKKLKSVVVCGKKKIKVAEEDKIKKLSKKLSEILLKEDLGAQLLSKYGSASIVSSLNTLGILPTKHFKRGCFEKAENISGETLASTILKKKRACYACPIACKRVVQVTSGKYAGDFDDGPEYETIAALGSLCLNSDLPAISMANHLCNLYSLDTISTGCVIAFAMDCYEKGIINEKDTDGIAMRWGDPDVIIEMIHKIAKREGFGNILAEGVKRAAKIIGNGAEEFAMETKGLETPMHEPRGKKGVGLMYAVANRGGSHNDATHDTLWEGKKAIPEIGLSGGMNRLSIEGKAELIKKMQDVMSILDSMIVCIYTLNPALRRVSLSCLNDIICYVTGWQLPIEDFIKIGERAINLGRLFNIREGFGRKDDTLPKRFMEPLSDGAVAGQAISKAELDKMLDEYYILRGWDVKTGVPTREKLLELCLT